MARGYPDFFGFSVFPYHGAAIQLHYADQLLVADQVIFTLAHKGLFLGGSLHLMDSDAIPLTRFDIKVVIDGSVNILVQRVFVRSSVNSYEYAPMGELTTKRLDNKYIVYEFNKEVAFGQEFQLIVDAAVWTFPPGFTFDGFWTPIQ